MCSLKSLWTVLLNHEKCKIILYNNVWNWLFIKDSNILLINPGCSFESIFEGKKEHSLYLFFKYDKQYKDNECKSGS